MDTHLQHVMGKLGFKSRARVAAWHATIGRTVASIAGKL
jgi:DNA-binding CsgD family transcriptional regulator